MKKLFLRLAVDATAIYAVTRLIPGIAYTGGWQSLTTIAVIISLVNMFIKPVIKLLALPVEIATLGLFSVVINGALLYLVAYWVPSFRITSFWFPGVSQPPLLIAPFQVPVFGTAMVGALLIGFISTLLWWLLK